MLQPNGPPSCDVIAAFGGSHFKKCWLQRTQGVEDPLPPPELILPGGDSLNGPKLAALMASHAHLPHAFRSSFVGPPKGLLHDGGSAYGTAESAEQQSLTALLARLGPALKSVQKARSDGHNISSNHYNHHQTSSQHHQKALELKHVSYRGLLEDPLSAKEGPCLLNSSPHVSDASVVWPATPAGSAPSPAGNSPSCSSSGQNPCTTSRWEGDGTVTHGLDQETTHWGTFRKRPRKGVRASSALEASASDKLPSGARSPHHAAAPPPPPLSSEAANSPRPPKHHHHQRESSPSSANHGEGGLEFGGDVELCGELSPRSAAGGRTCAHCGTQKTPLWRNGPCGIKSLCNACGIRFKKLTKKDGIQHAEYVYGPKSSPFALAYDASHQALRPTTPAMQQLKATSGIRKRKQEDTAAALAAGASDSHLTDRSRYHEGVKAAGYDPSAHPRKRQHKVKDAPEGQQRPRMRGNMCPAPYDESPAAVKKEEREAGDFENLYLSSSAMVDEEGAASALVALFNSF